MPEGHLIHWYAATQRDGLLGPTAVSSPQGRFRQAETLDGRELEQVEPYGKHLFYCWEDAVVHVHLGMQGLFLHHDIPPPQPRPQVRLRVAGPKMAIDLIAPIRCDLITNEEHDALVADLGPDPLRNDADPDVVEEQLRRRRQPIAVALLDQHLIAGVGNVVRAEALHAARIHPLRSAALLSRAEFHTLWREVQRILRDGALRGSIDERRVYKQQTCGTCGRPVEAFDLSGRTVYACPYDQPPAG